MSAAGASSRVFYGWIVVGAAFLVFFAAYGLQFTFGVFLPEFEREFGWSRAQITLPFTIYVAVYCSLSAITGPLTDRYGPRAVLGVGAVFLGGGYFLLSRVTELWHLYSIYALVTAAGMSTTLVPCNATVVRWFVRLRGRALGIMTAGNGVGTMAVPPLAGLLILALGWRHAYQALALGVLLAVGGAALLMARDPESRGLSPDGDWRGVRPPAQPLEGGPAWRVGEAMRTSAFWMLALAMIANFLFLFIPSIHLAAYAQDLGVSPARAVLAISAVGIGQALGRMGIGSLSDRIGRRRAAMMSFLFQVVSFAGLALIPLAPAVYLLAFTLGLGYGGFSATWPAVLADLYGRQSAGALIGAIFTIAGPTTAVGPFLAGWLYDAFGNYVWAFAMAAMANVIGLVLVALIRAPRRRPVR